MKWNKLFILITCVVGLLSFLNDMYLFLLFFASLCLLAITIHKFINKTSQNRYVIIWLVALLLIIIGNILINYIHNTTSQHRRAGYNVVPVKSHRDLP